MKRVDVPFKIYLGRIQGDASTSVFLEGFEWACDWYWSGGGVSGKSAQRGGGGFSCHFDGCFLDVPDYRGHPLANAARVAKMTNRCAVWEPLSFFMFDPQYDANAWWRIKDLYKQFYALRDAAEIFQYGGHCHGMKERSKKELNKPAAARLNNHIQAVIIPEIVKALGVTNGTKKI